MIDKLQQFLLDLRDRQRIAIALAKGGAARNVRRIDLTNPITWEFSAFSQNGEDGILDVLRSQLNSSNRYFVEIGTSDGIENNTAWLLITEKYNGLMIEGNSKLIRRAQRLLMPLSIGGVWMNMFVDRDNASRIASSALVRDPDVFSLDIDGIDYYVASAVLSSGIRPKIFVVEYNSVYGESRSITVEYDKDFVFGKSHPTNLYYGVSIAGWRKFFELQGYRFITVDRNGVNSFFVDPKYFSAEFLESINGLEFAENAFQRRKFGCSSQEQFKLIQDQRYVDI